MRPLEKTLDRDVETTLAAFGFTVVTIGGTRPQGQTGYVGNTPGIPDKAIRHRLWPRGVWLFVELKRDEQAINEMFRMKDARGVSQTAFWASGGSWVCHTVEAVFVAIFATAVFLPVNRTILEKMAWTMGVLRAKSRRD